MGTERNEAGESQELKAIPLCLLKKKRWEEKGREKNGESESESGSGSGSGSRRENLLQCQRRNRQFKGMAVSRFICDVPNSKATSKSDPNSTGHNPECSHPQAPPAIQL